MITVLTLTPLVGALVVASLTRARPSLVRGVGLGFGLAALAQAGALWWEFDPGRLGFQLVERHGWIPSLSVEYFVGVDGLGLLMVMLSAFVVPFALLSVRVVEGDNGGSISLLLLLQAGLFGTFTALNFFHWFIFWELSLVPAYFLIKCWGGPGRVAAATQFFVYTMVGSVAMLLGFLAIYLSAGTFDFEVLGGLGSSGELTARLSARLVWWGHSEGTLGMAIFLLVFLGFAVKVPLMPFHTWLPAAYAEAPTGVAMVLSGTLSKMGVYGFLRILLPLFPEQMRAVQTPLLWLAVATVVWSALAALAQRDLKRMLAYSSVNHLGYCLLGIFAVAAITRGEGGWELESAAALNGVLLQMFNHGVSASALFWFVGLIEERGGGRRGLEDFGGLRSVAPVFCGLMGIALFTSLGLPGLSGFVGEFLIFKGVFSLVTWAAVLSVFGLLVTAVFLLTILQRVFSGPVQPRWAGFGDLSGRERLIVLPSVVLMFLLGVYPQLVLQVTNPTVVRMVEQLP